MIHGRGIAGGERNRKLFNRFRGSERNQGRKKQRKIKFRCICSFYVHCASN